MSTAIIHDIPKDLAEHALIDREAYAALYRESIEQPDLFWSRQAEQFLHWTKPWDRVSDWNFDTGHIRWFEGAQLNASFNCLDRHLEQRGNQIALLWEGDEPGTSSALTYRSLFDSVCRCANALKRRGVRKGDRVCIYLPMIPEAAVAMLACARIGAVHSVVFAGFSSEALKDRILDANCRFVICADEGLRGGKRVPLKKNVDAALAVCPSVEAVFVVRHTDADVDWMVERDISFADALSVEEPSCPPESMDAEDPLFILYTSGSTGKPKGVVHTTGGYLLHAAISHKYVFDYRDGDIYWCTADVGWVTGHTYLIYGPLLNGSTGVMFEGVPTYPKPDRFWRIVEKYRINIFYTAPTVIRSLMGLGDHWVTGTERTSLRILGSVGEPINPEAWEWYYRTVGECRCPIVDTWWQTETGGIMITPLPGAMALKPGSAEQPFFGVVPAIVDTRGNVIDGPGEGMLVISRSWPGQARTVHGDHQRFIHTYFKTYPGYYFTGDGARRDANGDYWITGRVDDVLNVSGHRMGTAEIESALVLHHDVAEAAVVGCPHDVKGQGIYAFVTPVAGVDASDQLKAELIGLVRREIGAIATPDYIQFAAALPKTRSGKIMRRILRKVASIQFDELGDISTLADPGVVEDIIHDRLTQK
jgi:acetyl-CoA synthetase